jgi:O-antigen ligase
MKHAIPNESEISQSQISWLFALTLVGYPLAGMLSAATGLSNQLVSFPFRIVIVLLSILLMVTALTSGRRVFLDGMMLGFWLLYLLRLAWDVLVTGIAGAEQATLFFLLTAVIPCSAILLARSAWNEQQAAKIVFGLGSVVCILGVMMQFLGIGASTSLTEQTGRLSFESVNPITFGHAGATTIIAALAYSREKKTAVMRVWLMFGTGFGTLCLVLAASRGPLLALIVALFMFALIRRKWGWLLIAALVALAVFPSLISGGNVIEIYTRFTNISEDESALERLLIQAGAIQQFLDSPWVGSAFAELTSGEYPHNLVLESAMALGVPGLALFLAICLKAFLQSVSAITRGNILTPLLFVQYFIGIQLSGSLWGAAPFWACIALIAAIVDTEKKNTQNADRLRFQTVASV